MDAHVAGSSELWNATSAAVTTCAYDGMPAHVTVYVSSVPVVVAALTSWMSTSTVESSDQADVAPLPAIQAEHV